MTEPVELETFDIYSPLLSLDSVHSFSSVCPASPIATGSIVASSVCDISSGTHHVINPSRSSPAFRTTSDKSCAWRPGNKARSNHTATTSCPLTMRKAFHAWWVELDHIRPHLLATSLQTTCTCVCHPEPSHITLSGQQMPAQPLFP